MKHFFTFTNSKIKDDLKMGATFTMHVKATVLYIFRFTVMWFSDVCNIFEYGMHKSCTLQAVFVWTGWTCTMQRFICLN